MLKELKSGASMEDAIADRKIVVLDFMANWCNPCRILKKWLERMEQEGDLKNVLVLSIDIEQHAQVSDEFEIQGVPTLVLLVNGKKKKEMSGIVDYEHTKSELKKWFASVK